MHRHYRPMTLAQRDAVAERRILTFEARGIPQREPIPLRQDGRLLLIVDGQTFDVRLVADRRDPRMFHPFIGDEALRRSGLEQVWREIQRRRAPVLGGRNFDSY